MKFLLRSFGFLAILLSMAFRGPCQVQPEKKLEDVSSDEASAVDGAHKLNEEIKTLISNIQAFKGENENNAVGYKPDIFHGYSEFMDSDGKFVVPEKNEPKGDKNQKLLELQNLQAFMYDNTNGAKNDVKNYYSKNNIFSRSYILDKFSKFDSRITDNNNSDSTENYLNNAYIAYILQNNNEDFLIKLDGIIFLNKLRKMSNVIRSDIINLMNDCVIHEKNAEDLLKTVKELFGKNIFKLFDMLKIKPQGIVDILDKDRNKVDKFEISDDLLSHYNGEKERNLFPIKIRVQECLRNLLTVEELKLPELAPGLVLAYEKVRKYFDNKAKKEAEVFIQSPEVKFEVSQKEVVFNNNNKLGDKANNNENSSKLNDKTPDDDFEEIHTLLDNFSKGTTENNQLPLAMIDKGENDDGKNKDEQPEELISRNPTNKKSKTNSKATKKPKNKKEDNKRKIKEAKILGLDEHINDNRSSSIANAKTDPVLKKITNGLEYLNKEINLLTKKHGYIEELTRHNFDVSSLGQLTHNISGRDIDRKTSLNKLKDHVKETVLAGNESLVDHILYSISTNSLTPLASSPNNQEKSPLELVLQEYKITHGNTSIGKIESSIQKKGNTITVETKENMEYVDQYVLVGIVVWNNNYNFTLRAVTTFDISNNNVDFNYSILEGSKTILTCRHGDDFTSLICDPITKAR